MDEDLLSAKSIERMREKLERVPLPYRNGEDFNPFVHVIEILRSQDPKKEQQELERYCRSMDAVRKDLVNGPLPPPPCPCPPLLPFSPLISCNFHLLYPLYFHFINFQEYDAP